MLELQAELGQDDAQLDKVEPHLGKFSLARRPQRVIESHRLSVLLSPLIGSSQAIVNHRGPGMIDRDMHSIGGRDSAAFVKCPQGFLVPAKSIQQHHPRVWITPIARMLLGFVEDSLQHQLQVHRRLWAKTAYPWDCIGTFASVCPAICQPSPVLLEMLSVILRAAANQRNRAPHHGRLSVIPSVVGAVIDNLFGG